MKILPEEQDFDPEEFDDSARAESIERGIAAFNEGRYHDAHEWFERCWLAGEGPLSDLWKGLVQASISLHHLERGNASGARKLGTGMRRLLAPYLPQAEGFDLEQLLEDMATCLRSAGPPFPKLSRLTPR